MNEHDNDHHSIDAYPNEQIELQRFYLDTTSHGLGISNQLMAYTLDYARQKGYKLIWLGVADDNRRAIRFYEKMGFRIMGSHDFLLGNTLSRDLVMIRAL